MKRIFIFVIGLLIGAILLWISGYNFDNRSPVIAFNATCITVGAFVAATYPGIGD